MYTAHLQIGRLASPGANALAQSSKIWPLSCNPLRLITKSLLHVQTRNNYLLNHDVIFPHISSMSAELGPLVLALGICHSCSLTMSNSIQNLF